MLDRRWFPVPVGLVLVSLAAVAQTDTGPRPSCTYELRPNNPPNGGILFVDHSATGKSGHLGHALVEYQDRKILAFYPNCSGDNR